MGRAIDHDNILDDHERRIKLLEGAMEDLIQTKVHHVDLHSELNTHSVKAEGVEVEPDEEFLTPAGKRKKTTTKKDRKPKVVESSL